jgi:hypothetical protein
MTDALTAHIIAGQNLFLLVIDSLLTFPPLYSSLSLDKHSYYLAFEDGLQSSYRSCLIVTCRTVFNITYRAIYCLLQSTYSKVSIMLHLIG